MREETASAKAVQPEPEHLECYHCHDDCPTEQHRIEDKYFCCEGCKMVFEILSENDLCQYYKIDENAGVSLKNRRDARAYAWLDDEETAQKLMQYHDGHTGRVEFYLPQMHCASCIWLLEHLYRLDKGITGSKVNFLQKKVSIQFLMEETSLRKIAAMLAGIGYAPEINLQDVSDTSAKKVDRSLYYKIGAAGFAFGNIMLLSFPEYLGLEQSADQRFFTLFGYLNILLALPVLIYSARDYFVSAFNGLRHRHLNIDVPLSLGMLMLFGRSAWEIFTGTGAGYMDSFAGLVFFLLIGRWFQQKTYHRLSFDRDYRSYFPVAATVRNSDRNEQTVPIQKLNPGDIILVRNEELIPADGILLKGKGRIDYSFVTGESNPVTVNSGEQVFAGGKQTGSTIELSLTRKVSTSYLTQLWNDEAFKQTEKGTVSELADRAGKYFTYIILTVAIGAFIWWAPKSVSTAVNVFTAVLIIACPCAVALSIPFTLGNILRLFGRNRFYIKNTSVLEQLYRPNELVLDKTGTITEQGNQGIHFYSDHTDRPGLNEWENAAVRSLTAESNHPISRRIYNALLGADLLPVDRFEEQPGLGISGHINGKNIQIGSAKMFGINRPEYGTWLAINGTIRGRFETKNTYRKGLQDLLSYTGEKAISTSVLTGDNDREKNALTHFFHNEQSLLFNQSPADKLNYVKNLQSEGKRILFIGDGLNDAGALRQSNTGIVITENTNNFTPACDGILHADEFERLPQFMELAHWGVKTVNRAYILAAIYNIIGLSYAVSGLLSPIVAAILMPLSSITIVLFGVGMGHWKAWKMGF